MVRRHLNRVAVALTAAWLSIAAATAAGVESRIVVQDSPLAGFQFHAGKRLWPQLRVGDALKLVREPDNPHDPRAVRVEWQGQQIGYVPRRENDDVARLLDRGTRLDARITRLMSSRDPWQRVRFEIALPLQSHAGGDTPAKEGVR